ncbi:hypothetical protein FHQ18_06415 [Deferribacter autotrophicus]|uniref:Type II secretion system protein GspE N-terminal domain-containing protein n=1 Tax=Deferribacter autotrophicus TaxID=500465 RepID=A0A5A8F5N6_9BACT|nr:hypothetical protein [Deferribacter autotrophicus]KAA0258024.1 hypothetical protein FHQ18_06415 [Deferribacter autotrophicus]
MTKKNIGELLVEYGLINEKDLKEGLDYQKSRDLRLGEALVELGKVSYDDIEYILSKQLDIPFVILNEKILDKNYIKTFPPTLLKKFNFIPLYETGDILAIVTDDPFNSELINELEKLKQKKVQVSLANGRKIKELLEKIIKDESELDVFLKDWLKKLKKTSFYRLDFIRKENHIKVFAFGFGLKKELFTYNSNGELIDNIKKYFVKEGYDICFEKFSNESCEMITVFPIDRSYFCEIDNDLIVVTRFGLINDDILICLDKNVFSKNFLFSSKTYVPGYSNFVLDIKNNYNKTFTTVDYICDDRKFYFIGYIPKRCDCDNKGCDKCNNLGYLFEELEGYYTKAELKKLSGLKNG